VNGNSSGTVSITTELLIVVVPEQKGATKKMGALYTNNGRHAMCSSAIPEEREREREGEYIITYSVNKWANQNRVHYIQATEDTPASQTTAVGQIR